MKGDNIDLFNEYVAKIFATLYRHFPIPTDLSAEEIAGVKHDEKEYDNGFSSGTYFKVQPEFEKQDEVFSSTVKWLTSAGYIWTEGGDISYDQLSYKTIVLSPKTLQILNVIPAALEKSKENKSLGDQLSEAVKDGSTDAAKDLVKTGLSSLVGMVGNAI